MRSLGQFSPSDWLQLLPLQHAFKQLRNDVVQSAYLRREPAELRAFLEQARSLKGRDIGVIVAFEQPWVLDWMLRMGRRHVADATLIVFDNSRDPAKRPEIARVCAENGAPYLGLPPNPTRHVNRSHGMAMSWIFHNAVRRIEPRTVAFLDHDLIPLAPVNLKERLGDQPFFGAPNFGRWGWSLWAGYTFLDFAAVSQLPLNFLYDFSRDLDTGGRNWKWLYRNYDRSSVRFASRDVIEIFDSERVGRRVEIADDRWLHLCGVGYNQNFANRSGFLADLQREFDAGLTLRQLRERSRIVGAQTGGL